MTAAPKYPAFCWQLVEELAALAPAATPKPRAERPAGDELARRVRAYLDRIPPAVSGRHGHDRTFYAAGRLVRGFGLTEAEALPFFREWNARCQPPWDDRDLERKLREAARQPGPRGFLLDAPPPDARPAGPAGPRLTNWYADEKVDGQTVRKGRFGKPAAAILDDLQAHTGGWPRVSGGLPFARRDDGGVEWLDSPNKLVAWAARQYAAPGRSGLDWAAGPDMLTKAEFFAYCLLACERWDAVELFPHEPPAPGAFYLHPEPAGGDGRAFQELLDFFSPATPHDGELIRAFFLTLFWGGPCGQRPLFVFEGEDGDSGRGVGSGKSTVAEQASLLCGGHVLLNEREDIRDVQVRLNTPSELTKRIALYDNVKSLRFALDYLEAWITGKVFSGRALHRGEVQRPNRLLWVMTFNSPGLGNDLSSRSVTVRVRKPAYRPRWQQEVEAHIETHRWAIIGDILAELRKPVELPDGFTFTRRPVWDEQILGRCADPVGIQKLLADRRREVNVDDEEKAAVVEAIRELIRDKFGVGCDPDGVKVLIPSAIMFEKVIRAVKPEYKSPAAACRWLHTLKIATVSSYAQNGRRGVLWTGTNATLSVISFWGEIPP